MRSCCRWLAATKKLPPQKASAALGWPACRVMHLLEGICCYKPQYKSLVVKAVKMISVTMRTGAHCASGPMTLSSCMTITKEIWS